MRVYVGFRAQGCMAQSLERRTCNAYLDPKQPTYCFQDFYKEIHS